MKSKNTLKSHCSSEKSIKRGSVDLEASINAQDKYNRAKIMSHTRSSSHQSIRMEEIASQEENKLKVVVHKEQVRLGKPPEVPSLVVAARERAEQLKKPKVYGPQDTNDRGRTGSIENAAELLIESGSYPVKLNKRSVIKSPVLTSAA